LSGTKIADGASMLRDQANGLLNLGLIAALTACGGAASQATGTTPTPTPEAGADANETVPDAGPDAPLLVDAGPDVTDAPTDTGPTTCDLPDAAPSTHAVSITVTNGTASDRYLVTEGWFCDPFAIADNGVTLSLSLGFQCGCECPAPSPPKPNRLYRLAAGDTHTLTWDESALVTCTETINCATQGWTGPPMYASTLRGGSIAAPPGPYTVTVGALTTLPSNCNTTSSGDAGLEYSCQPSFGGPPSGSAPGAIQSICKSDVTGIGSFTLDPSKDGTVAVTITN
jgi:hypothetical protein